MLEFAPHGQVGEAPGWVWRRVPSAGNNTSEEKHAYGLQQGIEQTPGAVILDRLEQVRGATGGR